jgi:hypothetical protein
MVTTGHEIRKTKDDKYELETFYSGGTQITEYDTFGQLIGALIDNGDF